MASQVSIVVAALLMSCTEAHNIHSPPKLPLTLDASTCPTSYENHPLILISMDGFRAEYLTRGLTPTIEALGKVGVKAPYMKPSYPTITFPNHYTLATGLYPPSHGIVANKFYDPVFNAEFRVGRPESFKKRWWGGEPIWVTAKRQGKKSATFYWPGSEVDGNQADFWSYYNESISFQHRVDQVLAWLDLPVEERPQLITLYMHEPDSVGHDFGPNSREVEEALVHVDAMVKRLVEGLQERNLLSCVNVLAVADHGMAEGGDDKIIRLDNYIPNLKSRSRFWKGAFVRIQPNDGTQATKREMMDALSCKRPEMRVYEKTTLPIRWHISNQRRVEDIIVDVDSGFSVGGDAEFKADAGEHGYDNFFPVMNALFVAHGPDLQRNIEVEAFQNIELYNLMCHLVGVEPAPNNGTWGALHHMLSYPPPSPRHPGFETPPPIAGLPHEDDLEDYLMDDGCDGDGQEGDEWVNILADSQAHARQIAVDHMPWGIPALGAFRDSTVFLPHHDTFTAYSTLLRMPLWTSYTVAGKKGGSSIVPWRSDIRLRKSEQPSCYGYEAALRYGITRHPLFPPHLSKGESYAQLPFLTSNAVPVTKQMAYRWEQLEWLINQWAQLYGTLNVIAGPVFDYDADTFVDDIQFLRGYRGLKVPTHMFMVVTRCLVDVNHLSECPHTHVDAMAFVYPQYLVVSNCLNANKFAREFMAKVQDVEKITGLKFFTDMRYDDSVRLGIRIHSNIWGRESWWNRLQSNFYGNGQQTNN